MSIWTILGIEQTADRAQIRRAYSRRLKLTNPEDDAKGFQELRQAYDRALAHADWAERGGAQIIQFRTDDILPDRPDEEGAVWGDDDGWAEVDEIADERPADEPKADRFRPACKHLEALAADPAVTDDALIAAFRELLALPDFEVLSTRAWTETWIRWLIARHAPRTDVLIGLAAGQFGWPWAPPVRPISATEEKALPPGDLFDDPAPKPDPRVIEVPEPLNTRPDPHADEASHEDACRRFAALIAARPVDETALLAAFREIVAMPAMDQMRIIRRTESWIAALIAKNAPDVDVLIGPATSAFGWTWAPTPKTAKPPPLEAPKPRPKPQAILAPLDAVSPQDEALHRNACQDLEIMLADPAADPDAARAALTAILQSRALDSVSLQAWTEAWTAHLITNNVPQSDGLIGLAATHFGWDDTKVGVRPGVADQVLARRRDLTFLAAISRFAHPLFPALKALKTKPTWFRNLNNRLSIGTPPKVDELLRILRWEHPSLLGQLDSDALKWWDAYLSRPQLKPLGLWLTLIAPVLMFIPLAAFARSVFGLGADFDRYWYAWLAVSVVLWIGPQIAWLYGAERPRLRWREDWMHRAPSLAGTGWAHVSLLILLVATFLPPQPWLAAVLALAAVATFVWAYITGKMDPTLTIPINWQRPLRVRHLASYGYLFFFWVIVRLDLPRDVWVQMTAPLIAAAAAYVAGSQTLIEAWRDRLDSGARRMALVAFGALAAATPLAAWAAAPGHQHTPAVAALAAMIVLMHKVISAGLTGRAYAIRDSVMRYGWLVWVGISAGAFEAYHNGDNRLLFSSFWLMTGVGISVLGALWQMRPAPKPAMA